jgi:hypothetical protein
MIPTTVGQSSGLSSFARRKGAAAERAITSNQADPFLRLKLSMKDNLEGEMPALSLCNPWVEQHACIFPTGAWQATSVPRRLGHSTPPNKYAGT